MKDNNAGFLILLLAAAGIYVLYKNPADAKTKQEPLPQKDDLNTILDRLTPYEVQRNIAGINPSIVITKVRYNNKDYFKMNGGGHTGIWQENQVVGIS